MAVKQKRSIGPLLKRRGCQMPEGSADRRIRPEKNWIPAAGVIKVARNETMPKNPLLTAPNIVITLHLVWAARQARQRLMRTSAENVRAFL